MDSSAPPMWALPEVFECLEAGEASVLLDDLVEAFRSDTASRLATLRIAIAAGDLARVRAEVHSIKGSARQMGAEALAAACLEIETAIAHSAALPLPGRIDHLEVCFSTACSAMSTYAGSL
jgi:chemotaxis protein histidine kinase CheA